MKKPIRWKPATLAVVALLFCFSAIAITGRAGAVARALGLTSPAAQPARPATGASSTQQPIAGLPPAGSAGRQAISLQRVAVSTTAASTQRPLPSATATNAASAPSTAAHKAAASVPPTAVSAGTPAPVPALGTQPGVPDRIVAPEIGLDSKIIPIGWREITNPDGTKSAEWNVASYAVSWHKTSARLGEVGNTVLTGHNNIEGEVFRHLEDLKLGDPITIYSEQRAFHYAVADRFIVQEVGVPYEQRLENAKWIELFSDERVTLMSCWPYTGDTHRIFIIAKPIPNG